jgi:hypothetical protein
MLVRNLPEEPVAGRQRKTATGTTLSYRRENEINIKCTGDFDN